MSSMELDADFEGESHRAEQYSKIGVTRCSKELEEK